MRGSRVLVAGSFAFVAFGAACIDLFHGTDFETFCTRNPTTLECGGDGSTGDASTETGTDARPPHPDFCRWTPAEARAQAEHACAWLGACEGPLGESAFGPCVVRAQLAYDCAANPSLRPAGAADDFWGCLATVQTCGDVDRCVFPAGTAPCKAVASGSFIACSTTNGAVRVRCASPTEGPPVGVEPCAMLGQTCTKDAKSAGSTALCSGTSGFTCTKSGCSGNAANDCSPGGFDQGIDCTNAGGGTCAILDGGTAPLCTAGKDAPECIAERAPTCGDPTFVTSCIAGRNIRVNCNQIGLPCDETVPIPSYDPAAGCVRRTGGDICSTDDTCNGTKLGSCGRGALYELDCGNVGLGTCKVTNGRAACTRP